MDTAAAYFNGPDTPIDPKSKGCQVNALLVITDGAYFGKDPLPMTRTLAKQGIKTWVIGFGLQGSWVKQKYTQLADAGDDGVMNGSGKPMFADNWKDLLYYQLAQCTSNNMKCYYLYPILVLNALLIHFFMIGN
mgnify:CR=1 FL=1